MLICILYIYIFTYTYAIYIDICISLCIVPQIFYIFFGGPFKDETRGNDIIVKSLRLDSCD